MMPVERARVALLAAGGAAGPPARVVPGPAPACMALVAAGRVGRLAVVTGLVLVAGGARRRRPWRGPPRGRRVARPRPPAGPLARPAGRWAAPAAGLGGPRPCWRACRPGPGPAGPGGGAPGGGGGGAVAGVAVVPDRLIAGSGGKGGGPLAHRVAEARSLDLGQVGGDRGRGGLAAAADDDEIQLAGADRVTQPQ